MKNLIIIPARAGSKEIKNKNLKIIKNKFLVDYSIEFAQKIMKEFNSFDLVLSTDSKKILSRNKKNKYKYIRPKRLASDKSLVTDALIHCVNWYEKEIDKVDNILMLSPTSPLRLMCDFKSIFKKFKSNIERPIVSVIKMKEHPSECIQINNGCWNYLKKPPEKYYGRQSYFGKYYFIDGSFYMINKKTLIKNKSFFISETVFHKLKNNTLLDIDTKEDLKYLRNII